MTCESSPETTINDNAGATSDPQPAALRRQTDEVSVEASLNVTSSEVGETTLGDTSNISGLSLGGGKKKPKKGKKKKKAKKSSANPEPSIPEESQIVMNDA